MCIILFGNVIMLLLYIVCVALNFPIFFATEAQNVINPTSKVKYMLDFSLYYSHGICHIRKRILNLENLVLVQNQKMAMHVTETQLPTNETGPGFTLLCNTVTNHTHVRV